MDPIISPGQIQPEIPQNSKFSFLKSAKVWPFIVLLALLIPAGTYFLGKSQTNNQTPTIQTSPTPTSDPTANWKIYSGAGFSFKYPPTFYVEKNESGADYISDSKSSLDTWRSSIYEGKLQDSQLVINVLELNENFKGKIPGSMIYRMLGEPTTVPSTIFNIEGSQGVKVIYKNEEHYGIAFQDKFIWISAKPASSNLIKTFETMMSAFKLTQ